MDEASLLKLNDELPQRVLLPLFLVALAFTTYYYDPQSPSIRLMIVLIAIAAVILFS